MVSAASRVDPDNAFPLEFLKGFRVHRFDTAAAVKDIDPHGYMNLTVTRPQKKVAIVVGHLALGRQVVANARASGVMRAMAAQNVQSSLNKNVAINNYGLSLHGLALGHSEMRLGVPIKVYGDGFGRRGEGVVWVPENRVAKYMSPTEESILDFGHPDLPERYNIYQVLMPSWQAYMQKMGARPTR